MNKKNSNKKIIGILGESGQGKSSLLNAILEKRNLLPSGCFGASTAVITQIEANLTDSNYTADIEVIPKEVSLFTSILFSLHYFFFCDWNKSLIFPPVYCTLLQNWESDLKIILVL